MMMKKIFALLLCLAIFPFGAMAEEMDVQLDGFVTEIVEGGFLMEDAELGLVMVNTSEATVWDGVLLGGELAAGQYVIVDYSGRLTRSIPPQAHADRVGCYMLSGVVSEILPEGFLLVGDETFGEVIVQTGDMDTRLHANMLVTVYYDGVMTMSLPGKVNARAILVPQLEGVVSGLTDEGFTLTLDDGQTYAVHMTEHTLVGLQPVPAEEKAGEETEAEAEAESASEEVISDETEPVTLSDGDRVTVYYSGVTTMSLPPQVAALEVLVDTER